MHINIPNFAFRLSFPLQFSVGLFLLRNYGCKRKERKICSNRRAVIMILFLFCESLVSMASVSAQVITVEPQVQYNVSGQDDLKLIRKYSREASWENPIPNETWNMLKPLGVSKARLINVESENSVSIDPRTKAMQFDFSDRLLAGLRTVNLRTYSSYYCWPVPQKTLATGIKMAIIMVYPIGLPIESMHMHF